MLVLSTSVPSRRIFLPSLLTRKLQQTLLPALPPAPVTRMLRMAIPWCRHAEHSGHRSRSEEHTSELQSRFDLVCRLLLEKKNDALHTQPLHNTPVHVPNDL